MSRQANHYILSPMETIVRDYLKGVSSRHGSEQCFLFLESDGQIWILKLVLKAGWNKILPPTHTYSGLATMENCWFIKWEKAEAP